MGWKRDQVATFTAVERRIASNPTVPMKPSLIIDCDLHNGSLPDELNPYLSAYWRNTFKQSGACRPPAVPYYSPVGVIRHDLDKIDGHRGDGRSGLRDGASHDPEQHHVWDPHRQLLRSRGSARHQHGQRDRLRCQRLPGRSLAQLFGSLQGLDHHQSFRPREARCRKSSARPPTSVSSRS